jgi:hypothetical protein
MPRMSPFSRPSARIHSRAFKSIPARSDRDDHKFGYIGLNVHQASISIAVIAAAGKLLMECVIETKAASILDFIRGVRGSLWVTFEEGTSAAWLYDLLKPHVTKVIVCDPRKNALLKAGNKNDRVDARKLSDLLRAGLLAPVYHGESGVRAFRRPLPLLFRNAKDSSRSGFPRFETRLRLRETVSTSERWRENQGSRTRNKLRWSFQGRSTRTLTASAEPATSRPYTGSDGPPRFAP